LQHAPSIAERAVEYFGPGGKVAKSDFFPNFPQTVELDA